MYEFDTCDKFMSCGNSWATKDIGQVLTVIAVLTKTLCQSLDSNKSIDLVHNVLLAHFNNDNSDLYFRPRTISVIVSNSGTELKVNCTQWNMNYKKKLDR